MLPSVWPIKSGILSFTGLSLFLVTEPVTVGIYDVALLPASNCQSVTEPLTVRVKSPAVGVKVKETLLFAPVPTKLPENAPDKVTVPVP